MQLSPEQYRQLPDYGLGLTDIAKFGAGMDRDLDHSNSTWLVSGRS
jgi:hypothetical protein